MAIIIGFGRTVLIALLLISVSLFVYKWMNSLFFLVNSINPRNNITCEYYNITTVVVNNTLYCLGND